MSTASLHRPTRPTLAAFTALGATLASGSRTVLAWLRQISQTLLVAHDPEPRTAAEVLVWARRIEARGPGFAADLRAAALRSMAEPTEH